jgi:hypothetical protein
MTFLNTGIHLRRPQGIGITLLPVPAPALDDWLCTLSIGQYVDQDIARTDSLGRAPDCRMHRIFEISGDAQDQPM